MVCFVEKRTLGIYDFQQSTPCAKVTGNVRTKLSSGTSQIRTHDLRIKTQTP